MQKRTLVLVVALLLGAVTAGLCRDHLMAPLSISEDGYLLYVEKGDSLANVINQLHSSGVLEYPQIVVFYGRWTGQDLQIKPGEYLLRRGLTSKSLLDVLESGEVVRYQVTLPEGITLRNALKILAAEQSLESILTGEFDPRIMELIKPHTKPEGLFFPDSYQYVQGDSDLSILERAYSTMNSVLTEEWEGRAENLPMTSPYEALIMASIIERETGHHGERGKISGVFTRRLQRGMLLQTDPTVIYGLGETFGGDLKSEHLTQDTNVYNTYRHPGLPPTPIALPGKAAIRAALHPEPGSALYFVARGDGGHVFSETLEDHNKAVYKHQLKRRKDYRSAPGESE